MYQTHQLTIDDQVTIEGYITEGELWNGFETPRFEVQAAIDFLKATQIWERIYFQEALSYEWNPVAKVLCVWLAEGDAPEEYQATQIDGYGDTWFVSMGAFSWCWSKVTE